jgi:large subunit ribosomal protein L17
MRSQHRNLALRNMATALLVRGEIRTTRARSRYVAALTDRLIAIAQDPALETFNKYREIRRYVQDRRAVSRILDLAAADPDRRGSFVRRFLLGARRGDAAPIAVLRLIKPGEEREKPVAPAPAVVAPAPEEKPRRRRGFLGFGRKKPESPPPEKKAKKEKPS